VRSFAFRLRPEIAYSREAFRLFGFERIDGAEYMQSWIIGWCD